jgi:hypothetical protein
MLQYLLRVLRWPLVASAAVLLVFVTSTALAGSGVGAVFNLGRTNSVNNTSSLTGTTSAAQLKVTNASSASSAVGISGQSASPTGAAVSGINLAGGPGLQATVKAGSAPLKVNSAVQVANLNASLLGGHDASYYLPSSAVQRFGPLAVTAGNVSQTLFKIGQLTFIGECYSLGSEYVRIDLETSADHAAWSDVSTDHGLLPRADADFHAAFPDILADTGYQTPGAVSFNSVTGAAVSADSHEVFFDLYMGQNARGATGNNCVFGGTFMAP